MKKPKLSRKRCSPLPDIYTPIDKTSMLKILSKCYMMYSKMCVKDSIHF